MPREGHPLKEGLRHCMYNNIRTFHNSPREGHPLKEGLRLKLGNMYSIPILPREGHPLKEGLRP